MKDSSEVLAFPAFCLFYMVKVIEDLKKTNPKSSQLPLWEELEKFRWINKQYWNSSSFYSNGILSGILYAWSVSGFL